jgi:hypothetical protein
MSIVNAWILFKRVTSMELAQFREHLAIELCQDSLKIKKKKGRKSIELVENQMQDELNKRIKRTPTASIPSEQIRMDGYQLLPQFEKKRRVCRYPGCKYQSFAMCFKCILYLCCNIEIVLCNFTIINIVIYITMHLFTYYLKFNFLLLRFFFILFII